MNAREQHDALSWSESADCMWLSTKPVYAILGTMLFVVGLSVTLVGGWILFANALALMTASRTYFGFLVIAWAIFILLTIGLGLASILYWVGYSRWRRQVSSFRKCS
jgi:hypothetical protein